MTKNNTLTFLIFLLLFCLPFESYAQMANIWYFGKNAGINFNSNPPMALTDGQLDTREGCATICDRNGMLLFYTNGVMVFDRNHQPMPNGNGLLGNASSLDAVIIIPKPGNLNIYYIFTCDALENNHINGYRYSEVDMSLNGGHGAVTSQKNILLYAPSTERLTAVKHANGTDYWIITKRFGNNNTFSVYKIDCNGVTTVPVNSNAGRTADAFGGLKASPNGKKIGMTLSGNGVGQILDFDNATGVLSNAIVLDPVANFQHMYGIEFSPNSKLVYQTINIFSAFNIIYQYDISSNDQTTVNLSRYDMISAVGEINTGLKLAPDKKIYVNAVNRAALTVINNPDVYGAGCNLSSQSFQLNGRLCNYGLPLFVNSFLTGEKEVDFTKDVRECKVEFNGISTLSETLPWLWDFGDGNLATGKNVTHIYSSAGTYETILKRIRFTTCGTADTFYAKQNVVIDSVRIKAFAGNDTSVLANLPFSLHATSSEANVTYAWMPTTGLSNPFVANPTATLQNGITYHVTATNINGCSAADDIIIRTFENDEVFVPAAFTPNNDRTNDHVNPVGPGLKEVILFEIFNRYGQLLFKTNQKNKGWDGSFYGKPQPNGTYTYILEALTYKGRTVKETGFIILIR